MRQPIRELETRVNRTYRGGLLLDEFLGNEHPQDGFTPEDWVSSFTEAKNKIYIEQEGITRTEGGCLITDVIRTSDFGKGRKSPGMLVKLLDSGERLGIQVHPDDECAGRFFGSRCGKTECWYILNTRENPNGKPFIYLGFREWVTREIWRDLFRRQDIAGMLHAMHAFEVQKGDTILMPGGMPHAIGAGCFLLELQQPSDYTLRAETTTAAGERLTPQQIHYGIGEEAMLECFDYTPRTRTRIQNRYFLSHPAVQTSGCIRTELVTYDDTACFALTRIQGNAVICQDTFVTLISLSDGSFSDGWGTAGNPAGNAGAVCSAGSAAGEVRGVPLTRGEKYFIPCNTPVRLCGCDVLICHPPRQTEECFPIDSFTDG